MSPLSRVSLSGHVLVGGYGEDLMPSIYVTDMPRSTPRAIYKALHRLYRIAGRESVKAMTDALVYGFGAVRIGTGRDGMEHVPTREFY